MARRNVSILSISIDALIKQSQDLVLNVVVRVPKIEADFRQQDLGN